MSDAESGHVEVSGARIYYEAEGSGPPLTLVHACVAHLRMWDEQVAAWRADYRVIRYDIRGWGRSRTEDVPYANYLDLGHVLDALGVRNTHLLGASCGGSISLDFALDQPDRVRSLTLVASGLGGFNVDEPELADVWQQAERLEEAHDWGPLVELETRVWTDGPGQPRTRVDPDVRRRMVEWNLESYRAEQVANQIQRLAPPAAGRLSEIKVPALIVWGTFDVSGMAVIGDKLASEIAGARRQVFDAVAHMISLERPAEFNRLVLDFLREVDAGRPTDDGSAASTAS